MKGCVICNGDIRDYAWASARIAACDLVIAANGGSDHLRAMGLAPHVIIGDMDSGDAAARAADANIEQIRFPREKDKTDGELAVDLAFARGCDQVLLLGAAGGRLDHFLGNVGLLAQYPGRLTMETHDATLAAVDQHREYVVRDDLGATVSLIPFPRGERVTTSGLKYPLSGQDLLPGTRGISNVLSAPEARIGVGGGLLLVYVEREGQADD